MFAAGLLITTMKKKETLFNHAVKKQGIMGDALFFVRQTPQMKNVYRRDSGLLMDEMFYSSSSLSLFSLLEVTATGD